MTQRAALGLAALLLAVGASSGVADAAGQGAARTTGACADANGVTVLVDYAALGGGVVVACAAWPVADGFDALAKAGFSVTQVVTQPGFVCRIDGKPAADPCQVTPPPDAHWSYFHAHRGGSWVYSALGAGAYHPEPGGVEGWAFGASDAPGQAPPPANPPPTTPPPTSPPPTRPPTSQPPTSRPPTTVPTAPPATQPSASTTAPPSTTPGASGTPSASATPTSTASTTTAPPADETTTPAVVDTAPAAGGPASGGSPVGLLVTLGILIALAAALVTARRLRSQRASTS